MNSASALDREIRVQGWPAPDRCWPGMPGRTYAKRRRASSKRSRAGWVHRAPARRAARRIALEVVAITVVLAVAALPAAHERAPGASATPATSASPGAYSAYCTQVVAMRARAGMTFESEATIIRNAAPLAPLQLRDDFRAVALALAQVRDVEDGATSDEHVSLVGTQQLSDAMGAIDNYTSGACGVHVAQVLPSLAGY